MGVFDNQEIMANSGNQYKKNETIFLDLLQKLVRSRGTETKISIYCITTLRIVMVIKANPRAEIKTMQIRL